MPRTNIPDMHHKGVYMQDTTEKIQWHPAFYDAIKAELDGYQQYLTFTSEHQLTTEPLRIDLLIIKKLTDVKIEKNIARIFQRDNILEYKSPDDSLAVGDYFKVFAYAYIYAYLQKIDIRDLTITLVSTMHPDSLISYLNQRAEISVEKVSNGLYYIHNEVMPVQILATKYLSEEENMWLTSLTDEISEKQFEKVIRARLKLKTNINTLLYALVLANPEILEEGYRKMGTTLKAALDEIGFVDRRALDEAEKKIAEITRKADKAEQKRAQAELEKAQVEQEKAQLAHQAEQEKAQLYKMQKEAALDMLRMGTPISYVMKWTTLQETEIMKLKESIEFSTEEPNL